LPPFSQSKEKRLNIKKIVVQGWNSSAIQKADQDVRAESSKLGLKPFSPDKKIFLLFG
jgi:hypothetical protein